MRNSDCVIRFTHKGKVMQTILKDKDAWFMVTPKNTLHRMTAEQVLSHLLPPLAHVSPSKVEVEDCSRANDH